MVLVESIREAEAELQFRDEFEEREIEIATHTNLNHCIVEIKLHDVLVYGCKVYHWVYTRHNIRTAVVESLAAELQVNRQ